MTDAPAVPLVAPAVRYGTPTARWVLAATVLGSGVAFLDGTIVNVALPAVGRDLHASVGDLQWTVDAYLVTLSALLLLGGSLGDAYGRRTVFVAGLGAFTAASVLCGLAPSPPFLVVARAVQGVGGAMLVPGSLSIIAATFHPDDRARAVGAWSGLSGVSTAVGPFVGGWLIDAATWRLIFLINVPLAAAAAWVAVRHVPDTRDPRPRRLDGIGALLVTVGLGGIAAALIDHGGAVAVVVGLAGAAALAGFVVRERSAPDPMLPLGVFRSLRFTGANLTTLTVYAALGGSLFLVVLRLQVSLGYSALAAGASLVPLTAIMLLLSPSAGRLGQSIGPRIPMTVGPLVVAGGLLLLARVSPGAGYAGTVLPAVVVFGLGLTLTVAPLTATVLASVDERHTGVASGTNNAVARLAQLLAVAVLPVVAGIDAPGGLRAGLDHGYGTAMLVCAGLCVAGGLTSAALVREARPVEHAMLPDVSHPCSEEWGCRRQAS